MNSARGALPAGWPVARSMATRRGISGMEVIEKVQPLPKDKAYLTYLPFPTELCVLCKPRTKKGLQPACVQHCMANVIQWGPLEDLAKKLGQKPRMVLWSPR